MNKGNSYFTTYCRDVFVTVRSLSFLWTEFDLVFWMNAPLLAGPLSRTCFDVNVSVLINRTPLHWYLTYFILLYPWMTETIRPLVGLVFYTQPNQ